MNKLILISFLLFTDICFAQNMNRIIFPEFGYSTDTSGFSGFGYGRALNDNNVIALKYISFSKISGSSYNLEYLYFFNNQSNHSYLLGVSYIQNEFDDDDFKDNSFISPQVGFQVALYDNFLFLTQLGHNFSTNDNVSIGNLKFNFTTIF